MQDAISKVEQWAKDWGVTINESKTASMLFSLSTKLEQFRLKVNGQDIPASSTIKYLGVTFDQRLTWSKHILDISSRATLRMRILKKLAGTQNSQASLHMQCETGTKIWFFGTAAPATLQKLDKIQNTGLRIISGGIMKSTPIYEMESLAGLKSLEEQREEKIVLQAEKYKPLQRHPMHKKMSELSSYRIKRSSFQKTAKAMCAKHSDIIPQGEDEIEPLNATRSGRVHH